MSERINKIEIITKKSTWESNTEKIILYADFMGFKNRIFSRPLNTSGMTSGVPVTI